MDSTFLKTRLKIPFMKNMFTLLSGSMLAQVITLAISPLLTRIYSPEEFGVFAVFSSLIMMFSTTSSFKLETAIVIAKTEITAIKMVYISLVICIIYSLTLMMLQILFFNGISLTTSTILEYQSIFYLIPLAVLMLGINNILTHWLNRRNDYKKISIYSFSRSITVASTQIVLGFFFNVKTGLIYGQIAGPSLNNLNLLKEFFVMNSIKDTKLSFKEVKKLLKEYNDFIFYGSPQALLNSISRNSPPVILALFFSPVVVGLYALSYKMLQMPISLISDAMRKIFLKEINGLVKIKKSRELGFYLLKSSTIIFLISVFLFSPIILFGENIFVFIFGENWSGSGQYVSLLSLWLIFKLSSVPIIVFYQVTKNQKKLLIFEIFFSLTTVGSLFVTGQLGNPEYAIFIFSILSGFFYVSLISITVLYLLKSKEINYEN